MSGVFTDAFCVIAENVEVFVNPIQKACWLRDKATGSTKMLINVQVLGLWAALDGKAKNLKGASSL